MPRASAPQGAGGKEQVNCNGEKNNKRTDVSDSCKTGTYGIDKDPGRLLRFIGDGARTGNRFVPFIKPKTDAHGERGQDVRQIQEHSGAGVGEYAGAYHAQNERGTGIVAERKHPFTLCFGTQPPFVGRNRGARTDGISADDPHDKGAGTRAV